MSQSVFSNWLMKSSCLVCRGEAPSERGGKRAMVGVYHELASLQDPWKVLGGYEMGEKFAVISGILLLSLRRFP